MLAKRKLESVIDNNRAGGWRNYGSTSASIDSECSSNFIRPSYDFSFINSQFSFLTC